MTRPFVHALIYGLPGTKKSTLVATFPKPMIVLAFDPPGKMGPYLRQGDRFEDHTSEFGRPITVIFKDDEPLIQIEHFIDTQLNAKGDLLAHAYRDCLKRFPSLYQEIIDGRWATLVGDSLTMMARASLYWHQYVVNPLTKEPRQWHASATSDLERLVGTQFVGLRANVALIAHVDTDKDEVMGCMVGQPSAPGRLSRAQGLAAGYPEMYYTLAKPDDKDKDTVKYYLQTKPSTRYNCNSSLLNAPNMIEDPTWDKLWSNSPWK